MLPTKEMADGKAVIAPPLLVAGNCFIANQLRAIKKNSPIIAVAEPAKRFIPLLAFLFSGPSDRSNEIPSPDNHVTARVPVTRM